MIAFAKSPKTISLDISRYFYKHSFMREDQKITKVPIAVAFARRVIQPQIERTERFSPDLAWDIP